jgi:hypothetical protein
MLFKEFLMFFDVMHSFYLLVDFFQNFLCVHAVFLSMQGGRGADVGCTRTPHYLSSGLPNSVQWFPTWVFPEGAGLLVCRLAYY